MLFLIAHETHHQEEDSTNRTLTCLTPTQQDTEAVNKGLFSYENNFLKAHEGSISQQTTNPLMVINEDETESSQVNSASSPEIFQQIRPFKRNVSILKRLSLQRKLISAEASPEEIPVGVRSIAAILMNQVFN